MSNNSDITYFTSAGVFNMRVGAIVIQDDKVLLVNNGLHYYSVGGRVKLHETLEHAVVREVFEETGENFEIDRLVWINEGFFTLNGGIYDGKRFHEISFYFLMKPKLDVVIANGRDINEGNNEWLEWVRIDQLSGCIVYPEVFKTGLRHLPESPTHVVNIE
jgi:ADP-ribose pyrophosphatase YjhB (NUDIX family)